MNKYQLERRNYLKQMIDKLSVNNICTNENDILLQRCTVMMDDIEIKRDLSGIRPSTVAALVIFNMINNNGNGISRSKFAKMVGVSTATIIQQSRIFNNV